MKTNTQDTPPAALPAFRFSASVVAETGAPGEGIAPVFHSKPNGGAHVYLDAQWGGRNERRGVIYRGRIYGVGGIHLYRLPGSSRWVFADFERGRSVYFSPDRVEKVTDSETGAEIAAQGVCSSLYYLMRAIYSSGIALPEIPNKGREEIGRKLLAEFNAYAAENAAMISARIAQHAIQTAAAEVEKLENEEKELLAKLAEKRAELAKAKANAEQMAAD